MGMIGRFWAIQIIRFLLVGVANTIFGYTIFAMFILLGLHYAVAVLLASICGVLWNFKTTGTIVFKNRDNRLILRFIGVYVLIYFLNVGFLRVCGLSSLVGQAVIILPLALLTFWLQKKYVFKEIV